MNRIIKGDACEVLKSFSDECIDLIVTDIPYGINYKSNKQNCDTRREISVNKTRESYFEEIEGDDELPVSWLEGAYRVLKDKSAMYVFCHWSKWHLLYLAVQNCGFLCKNMIVLNKSNHGMGDLKGQYAPKHELLLFATKGRHLLNFANGRMNDVWDAKVLYSGSKRNHPNEKPLSWLEPCILNSSKEGDVVLDPFCGSGSTGVAAQKLGRNYIMIDIDEQWINLTKSRLV